MNVLSLFDGMSCGQIALKKSKINVNKYFASEIKSHAIKVTQHNFPNTTQLGDITKWKDWNLPKIDLIIGGSPCQDFSQANQTKLGLEGNKSSLFYCFYDILKHYKPKYFLLENVEMDSKQLGIISELLKTFPIKINSELVSAQLRERMYWTNIGGYYNDLLGFRHCDIPQPKDIKIELQDIISEGYTDRTKARCLLESDSRPLVTPVKMYHRYASSGFTTLIFKNKEHYKQCKEHYELNYKGLSADEIQCNSNIYDGLRYMNQFELECCQTVPIGYTSILNRNEAACLLGDGWTVDVISHIFNFIEQE